MASHNFDNLLLSEIRDKVQAVFGYRPCLWQLKVVRAILKRDRDVASIAATGSGKTLTFWMPLLFIPDGIQIVVTPLNILGKQNVDSLAKVGISAITITAETASEENFQAIAEGRHRAVVTNIETLMKPGGGFEKLWNNKDFMSKVISVVWDEAQCVSKWGDFRPEYKTAGTLRNLLPKDIPFYITSATLPPDVLHDVMATLGMRETKTEIFMRSNDRSNIHITVRKMKYPMNSFKDLAFLIPLDWDGTQPLPYKFVIFFDSITESIAAAEYLRGLLPLEIREKIKWFNSEMSPEFRAEESDNFNEGRNFGLACTESFGMGIDLPDITLVIQWKASCDMCTLWQRFGRGARNPGCEAIALFLVEPMYFDQTKEEKAARKEKRDQNAADRQTASSLGKRKAPADGIPQPPAKKAQSDGISQTDTRSTASTASTPLADLRIRFIASPPRSRLSAPSPHRGTDPLVPEVITVSEVGRGQPNCEVESDDESDLDAEEVVVALEDRREAYRKDKVAVVKKKKKDGNELSPEMDDMINAGSESRQIKCFRVPAQLYFGSDKMASDHKECRADLPDGCLRCVSKTPLICCELCTPAHFESFAIVDLPKVPPIPSKSRIRPYKAEASDMDLRDALHQFRRTATETKFSRAVLKNSGPGLVMSNEVLQRIVDCAHVYKIQSIEQLARETRWAGATEFGFEVVALINEHRPVPTPPILLTSTPLSVRDENTPSTNSRKCSKCKATGHIASNRKCPYHPLHAQHQRYSGSPIHTAVRSEDQNTDPVIATPSAIPAIPRPLPHPLYQNADTPYTPTASTSSLPFQHIFPTPSFPTTPMHRGNWLPNTLFQPNRVRAIFVTSLLRLASLNFA
ncbi:P-loop containing nucleoside triphosphate hydrolase protein [Mycena sp. CBHHK59/15]|nr:P-loop containing nucleoside triphosphate hydrolase protein [Mycena sp. CBHHK59/15]